MSDPATPQGFGAFLSSEVELFSVGGHDGYLRQVNAAFAAILGVRLDEINGRSVLEFVFPDDLELVVAGIGALERGEPEVLMETRFRRADALPVYLQWVARPVPGTDTWWACGRDTTAFHLLVSQFRDSRTRLELAVGDAAVGLWEADLSTRLLTWDRLSPQLARCFRDGLPSSLDTLAAEVHPEDTTLITEALQRLVVAGAVETVVRIDGSEGLRYLSLRGRVLTRDRRDRPVRAVGLLLDVTSDKALEEHLLRLVMTDELTGVPNRRAFDQALRTEWRRCARTREPLSVLMIDVDDFKRFNDTFGHPVGDDALISIARTLLDGLNRAGDVLARYGGEEFAVVLPATEPAGAMVVAERLLRLVRTVSVSQAPGWEATISIGVATASPGTDQITHPDLVTRADNALYTAKAAGKNRAHPWWGIAQEDAQPPHL